MDDTVQSTPRNSSKKRLALVFMLAGAVFVSYGFYTSLTSKKPATSVTHQSLSVPDKKDQKVNINTASSYDLIALPGVGEVTANKIIQGRPFTSTQELVERKIVNKGVFAKIEGLVSAP